MQQTHIHTHTRAREAMTNATCIFESMTTCMYGTCIPLFALRLLVYSRLLCPRGASERMGEYSFRDGCGALQCGYSGDAESPDETQCIGKFALGGVLVARFRGIELLACALGFVRRVSLAVYV